VRSFSPGVLSSGLGMSVSASSSFSVLRPPSFFRPTPMLRARVPGEPRKKKQNESKAKKNHAQLDSHLAPAVFF